MNGISNKKIFSWTVDRLPRDAGQKKASGVPFGVFVSPFGEMKKRRTTETTTTETTTLTGKKKREAAGKIARCESCFGYINAFCMFDEDGFNCALCGHETKWKNERERERYKRVSRYINGRNEDDPRAKKYLERLPELREEHNEFIVAAERVKARTSTSGPTRVILIDTTEGGSALEIAKSSAMAALEAVSAENGGQTDATFAIMTFDGGLTAYDVVGRNKVRVDDIDELRREEVLMSFEKVMQMRRVFARVDKYKEDMLAAIDSISSSNSGGESNTALNGLGVKMAKLSTSANGEVEEDPENGSATKTNTRGETLTVSKRYQKKRAFGPALSLVLDLLGAIEDEITEDAFKMMESEDRNIRNGVDVLNLNGMNDDGDAVTIGNGDDDFNEFEENEKKREEEPFEFDGARVLCFLSGMPNAGTGSIYSDNDEINTLLNDYLSEMSADLRAKATDALFMKEKKESASKRRNDDDINAFFFYEHCGRRASVNNVCIDTILCSKPSVFCGLHAISPISSISGGIVLRNDEESDAGDISSFLPSEIFKLLQNIDGRTARDCAIRLRTSSEYIVANAYGDSFREDKKYKGLYHVARMEKADAFAFDFDFLSKIGFGDEDDLSVAENSPPILQMAFEYTVTEYDDASTSYYWRRRIRRVCTCAKKVARTPREVRDFAKDDAVFSLLCRKVFHIMKLDGLFESRLLVIDWLTALISKLAKISGDTYVDAKFEKKHNKEVFCRCANAFSPTRLVYTLLISKNSPLVLMAYDGMSNENQPDLRSLNLFLCKDRLVGADLIDFLLNGCVCGGSKSSTDRNVEEAQDEKKMYYGYEGFLSFVERISSEEFLSL